tara:strand:+ start:55 stop:675 length:621 start_codon:yes stop_codon:yes gene_type:complete
MLFVISILLSSIFGLIIFLSHGYLLNHFLKTKNNLALSLMLPVITGVITKTISSNLFLSLGMIGALSIVRYRTPVKSTYELTLLFALVAVGIASIVNLQFAILLTSIIVLISFILYFLTKKNILKDFEFENANNNSELILKTSREFDLKMLDEFKSNLISFEEDYENDGIKTYILKFDHIDKALDLQKKFKDEKNILSINIQNYFN